MTFKEWLQETGNKPAPCNCFAPADGHNGHSPDCDYERSLMDLEDWYEDETYENAA